MAALANYRKYLKGETVWLKTVIQELIYIAGRLISTARRLKLRFSRHCPGYEAFRYVYGRLSAVT